MLNKFGFLFLVAFASTCMLGMDEACSSFGEDCTQAVADLFRAPSGYSVDRLNIESYPPVCFPCAAVIDGTARCGNCLDPNDQNFDIPNFVMRGMPICSFLQIRLSDLYCSDYCGYSLLCSVPTSSLFTIASGVLFWPPVAYRMKQLKERKEARFGKIDLSGEEMV